MESAKSLPVIYEGPLYSGHIHTLLGAARPVKDVQYERQLVQAADGCTVALDWLQTNAASPKGVILLFPGLTSTSKSEYIKTFAMEGAARGFHSCVVNVAGMVHGLPITCPHLVCGAWTSDTRFILREHFSKDGLEKRFGPSGSDLPVFGVGFSLGANVMCKYLAEEGASRRSGGGDPHVLQGAIAVSAPWDFHESTAQMEKFWQRKLYQQSMVNGLVKYLERNRTMLLHFRDRVDVDKVLARKESMKTVKQFDEKVIVPGFNYRNVEHYYDEAMCLPRLATVDIPLLCVTAVDDPITGPPPSQDRWEKIFSENDNVALVLLPSGGHLGYLQNPWRVLNHLPKFIDDYAVKALENLAANVQRKKKAPSAAH